ncbi:MAG: DUF2917 domain-containing protein [Pseudomonadota bacterium]
MSPRPQPSAEYTLRSDQPLRLEDADGRVVEGVSGTTWITAYGQKTDFMLRPGQRFVVPNDGLTLIEAIGCSRVRVAAPAEQAWTRRVARQASSRLAESLARLRQGLQPAARNDFPG